jgi:two-component system osmolarity sensor histidine kinase EnvZ
MSKRYLPKSLFARALLILVLPTLLIQIVTAYIFFDRHWGNVSHYMSSSLAGEVTFLLKQLKSVSEKQKSELVDEFESATNIKVSFENIDSFNSKKTSNDFPEFQAILKSKIKEKFTVLKNKDGSDVEIAILLPNQILKIIATSKRLESRTTTIFIGWMFGASSLFLFIAIIFLRNQIRPITKLAIAADNFGRGVDTPDFRPNGATEVRKAARAFIVMRERIRRQIRTRTDMLSGISHDLRTPLTRMKLQLAMLPDEVVLREDMREAMVELNDDVQQMQQMIQEYLDFARNEGREEAIKLWLNELLNDVVSDYVRMQQDVTITIEDSIEMDVRISSFRRMLHNLIDNALRYGKRCHLTLKLSGNYAEIFVDDEGKGIPEEKRIEVFTPFSRLEPSRNSKTGGVGLGLTIARDVAQAHGGTIALDSSPAGGLRVLIRLPI